MVRKGAGRSESKCRQRMNRIVNQQFGLGDILFLVPLIRKWQSQGDRIMWPICREYLNIQRNFPDINFVDMRTLHINYDCRTRFPWKEWIVEPLRWADLHKPPPANCMRAKYDMYDKDFMMWRELYWQRNEGFENTLYDLVVPGPEYNLISNRFGGLEQGQYTVPIKVENDLPNVQLRYIEGYNLLDWARVIENATHIHTVGSSINYMMEVLELKCGVVDLYKRKPRENHFRFYDYLLTKTYYFHE